MQIRAAVFREAHRPFSVEEVTLDPPKAGEVLVRMKAVGVCHSDYHLVSGATSHPVPCVVGHEGAGLVEALGPSVTGIHVGDHVALNWAPSCGSCFYCEIDRPSLCQTYLAPIWAGTMLDGTTRLSQNGSPVYHFSALACFADYAVVPAQCCVPLPASVPWEAAAVIGCAVTTGVGSVLNTAKVRPGSSVAVFGVGGVGLSTVMGAKAAGAEIILAVDRHPLRREKALELGATHAISDNAVEATRAATAGRGADYVFEAVGDPGLQETCLEAARPGGSVILSGIAPMGSGTNFPGAVLTRQEKTVMGSYYGTANPARDFPLYAQMMSGGKLPLDKLVSHRYQLEDIRQAYQDMLDGRTTRGVVVFE